jgi:hypothetical protein
MVKIAELAESPGLAVVECVSAGELDAGSGLALGVGSADGVLEHEARSSPTTVRQAAGATTDVMTLPGFAVIDVMSGKRLDSADRSRESISI